MMTDAEIEAQVDAEIAAARLRSIFAAGWNAAIRFAERYEREPGIPDDGHAEDCGSERAWEEFRDEHKGLFAGPDAGH